MPERKKIHILPIGDWLGHQMGKQHYGPEEAQYMVDRANKIVADSGNPIQIDYEHKSLNPPADGAPASGWMYAFTLENDGIWADVEWTPRAKTFIDNGEYKYISPVISPPFPDPVTGETIPIELFNAGLTNQPFMHDSIKQVVASALEREHGEGHGAFWHVNSRKLTYQNNNGGNMADLQETVDGIVAALPGATSADEVLSFLKKAMEVLAIMPGAPEGGAMPTGDEMGEMLTATKTLVSNSQTFGEIATLLEVDPDKVLATVATLTSKGGNEDELAAKLANVEARLKARDVADLIVRYENKITPAKRDFWTNHAETHGVESTESVLKEMPDVLKNTATKPVADPDKAGEPSEEYITFAMKKPGMTREKAIERFKKYRPNTTNKEA